MIRFLSHLFGKPYETCKSCEILKQQLLLVNEEKRLMTDTLIGILKPKVYEAAPVELHPISQSAGTFTKRRAVLEARDRENARILNNPNTKIASVDRNKGLNVSVEELEEELGIEETN